MADLDGLLELHNKTMIGFDFALATGALVAPDKTLAFIGHEEPSDDARELFRRCAPIWYTFAAAHLVAALRGSERDWWAVSWLRATELLTDVVWSRSAAFKRPGAKQGLIFAG